MRRGAVGRRGVAAVAAVAALATGATACATTAPTTSAADGATVVAAAASINAWGSILAQLGGSHAQAASIITNPDTDPHSFEPSPADARTIASSALFVENGIGYDPWAARTLAASPDPNRVVIDVGQLTGVAEGGNPHRWYSPDDVDRVADAITAGLKQADPADAAYFDERRRSFATTGLAEYHQVVADIRAEYAGTPVGASESIFAPLSDALGLKLLTPPGFLQAISEGTDPSAADTATVGAQISGHQIEVYVVNSQNSVPDVAAQVDAAKRAGIPVTAVTETLSPAGTTFQDWQVAQLRSLQAALAQATHR